MVRCDVMNPKRGLLLSEIIEWLKSKRLEKIGNDEYTYFINAQIITDLKNYIIIYFKDIDEKPEGIPWFIIIRGD